MDSLNIFILVIFIIVCAIYITGPILKYIKPEVLTNIDNPFSFKGIQKANKLIYKNGIVSSSNPHPVTTIDVDNIKTLFGLTLTEHEEANERVFGKNQIITAKDQEFILNATKKQARPRRKLPSSRRKSSAKIIKSKPIKTVEKAKQRKKQVRN